MVLAAITLAGLALGIGFFGVGALVVAHRRSIIEFASATLPGIARNNEGIRAAITVAFTGMGIIWMALGLGTFVSALT